MLLRHYLAQGVSKSALTRQLGIHRDTIHRWIRDGDLDRDLSVIERRFESTLMRLRRRTAWISNRPRWRAGWLRARDRDANVCCWGLRQRPLQGEAARRSLRKQAEQG